MRAAPAASDDEVVFDDFELALEVNDDSKFDFLHIFGHQVKKKRKVPKARANKKLQLFASCRSL